MSTVDEYKQIAARALGMKYREVVEVEVDGNEMTVQTHDGVVHELDFAPDASTAAGERVAVLDPDAVPDGSVAEVIAWVGEDKERAVRALAAEAAGKDRASLTAPLQKLAAG